MASTNNQTTDEMSEMLQRELEQEEMSGTVEMGSTEIDSLVLDEAQNVTSYVHVEGEIIKIVPHLARDGSLWFAVYDEAGTFKLINSKYVVEVNYAR